MTIRAFSRQWADGITSPASHAVAFAHLAAASIERSTGVLHRAGRGNQVVLDAETLLTERAALAGWSEPDAGVSVGGGSRLVRGVDGWMSLSLARPDDRALLPALFERDPDRFEATGGDHASGADEATWRAVAGELSQRSVGDITRRASTLGMSAAVPAERVAPTPSGDGASVRELGAASTPRSRPVVVDLSVLWAGPLCAHLLGLAGAHVVKVEAVGRLDGSRNGPPAFYDLLHGGHDSVLVDFADRSDVAFLHGLLALADVVITSSRPRALESLGIDREQLLRAQSISAWVSITGFGPGEPERVGFGDDAAVAGGLVSTDDPQRPRYVGDAIADPLTGLVAAARVVEALAAQTRASIEVDLASVAAAAAVCNVPAVRRPANTGRFTLRGSGTPAAAAGRDTEQWRARCT